MKIDKTVIIQFFKFAVVGVANTAVDWIIFFILTRHIEFFSLPHNEVWAKGISFVIAVLNSFLWNSLWTFRQEVKEGFQKGKKSTIGTIFFSRFFIVSIIGLIINTLVFAVTRPYASSIFPESLALAQIFSLFLATFGAVLWNFLANKFWTYQIKPENAQETQKNLFIYLIAGFFLIIMLVNSILVMRQDAGIVDEIAHIPAGYSYLAKQDFRLNPEHPPLAKAISAVPLLFLNLKEPFSDWSWQKFSQWEAGWNFIYHSGNSADQILFWSRLPMLLLTLFLGFLVFWWAKKLFGAKTGLFILFLFIFSPNILAHSHWVTTDIAAAVGYFLSIFSFWQYTKTPSRKTLIFAGLAFGIAQLLKFSSVLLIPILGIYAISRAILDRKDQGFWSGLKKQIWAVFQIFIIGFALVWLVYLILTWNTPLEIEKELINQSISETGAPQFNHFLKSLASIPIISAIGHYLLGLMMVLSHSGSGHTTFLLGNFSRTGWWFYFPISFLMKVPLPVLILIILSFVQIKIQAISKKIQNKEDWWFLIIVLIPLVVYWAFSINSKLNIGIRHLIPTLPLFYLLIARTVQPVISANWNWQKVILIILSVWYLGESLLAFPHYMAYFNETRLVLGLKKHQVLVDSNLDWGQDLKRLADFCQKNNIKEIKVDYFGGGVPKYYIPQAVEWHSKKGQTKGWLAISATFYQMSKYFGPQEGQPDYSYLDNLKPVTIVGDSILVYNIK